MPPRSLLGPTTAEEFLRNYWQQKPLLIRDACPDYLSPLTADELAGLATEADIESRIVLENSGSQTSAMWQLRHGPFSDADFAALPDTHWTLLVQAVDLWVPETRALLEQFDFLPAWRLDDLMVSYAPIGGSVGPHFDQYDVFLLQVEGERRWQIGERCDSTTPLVQGTDLKIVDGFVAQEDWLLEPGDMLYLPPNVAHWGVAESDCLTYSIGFRSPLLTDMLGDLAVEIAAQETPAGSVNDLHYRDPPLSPDMASDRIHPEFIRAARAQLRALIDDEQLLADWFARYVTMPKYPDLVDVSDEVRTAELAHAQIYRNGERQKG